MARKLIGWASEPTSCVGARCNVEVAYLGQKFRLDKEGSDLAMLLQAKAVLYDIPKLYMGQYRVVAGVAEVAAHACDRI